MPSGKQHMKKRRRAYRRRRRRVNAGRLLLVGIVAVIVIAAIVLAIVLTNQNKASQDPNASASPDQTQTTTQPTVAPTPEPEFQTPAAVDSTKPSVLGFETEVQVDGTLAENFARSAEISFGKSDTYTELEGITTFRGNNFRDTASYGTANITEKKFDTDYWTVSTGSLKKTTGSGAWTGSGWTGQPLIVRWPEETKAVMNLTEEAKAKQGLTEVIYATMDGHIYFLDLEDGSKTRDAINVGLPFKGAGSIDPRGIPIFYGGAGDAVGGENGKPRTFVYSLITGEKLYEYGTSKDSFAYRSFHAYDSAPLIDAATDTLIQPGENGILYTTKLNTEYDETTGELTVNPSEKVKWRYKTDRSSAEDFWWGMEDSCVMWKNYCYVADNGGDMMCIDINTMEVVWAQDIKDDTNGSPVFELSEDGTKGYIYIAPSLHWQKEGDNSGQISVYKIDASTGEIVWEAPYDCHTVSGVSGGVQATAALGKGSISDLLIVPIARTPSTGSGVLVALDKETGKEVWSFSMNHYAWSSPVIVYDQDGTAYVVQADSSGNLFLLDAKTGTLLDTINLGSNIEASPAVFENTIVVGTRGQKIVGINLK